MIEQNFTHTIVANNLNINVNTVSRWANGNNLEQIEKFIDLMILLNIDLKEIKKQ